MNQSMSAATNSVAECLMRKQLLQAGDKMQTGLHFEAVYASWISLRKIYFMQEVGQDLRQNPDFAAIINVE